MVIKNSSSIISWFASNEDVFYMMKLSSNYQGRISKGISLYNRRSIITLTVLEVKLKKKKLTASCRKVYHLKFFFLNYQESKTIIFPKPKKFFLYLLFKLKKLEIKTIRSTSYSYDI